MIKPNHIYNMDCLEGMKMIDDHSVDMILCDLPYGVTALNEWDIQIPLDKLWEQYTRISKECAAIVFTAIQPFTSLIVNSNHKDFKYEMIWLKDKGSGYLNAKKQPLRAHESVLVFYKKQCLYNPQMRRGEPYVAKQNSLTSNYRAERLITTYNRGERYPLSYLEYNHDPNNVHPTQKPVKLFEYLIKTYTKEGQTVLDPCMGSGTTALACQNTRRIYIGFETNNDYYKIIQDRLHTNCRKLSEYDAAGVRDEKELNEWAVSDLM